MDFHSQGKIIVKLSNYGNKQVVISSQMDSLLKLPEATSMGEVKKLRNIYDKLESHVRSL